VPTLHHWHGGWSSSRGDSTCGLKKAALQKSVLSGTHALLEGSNQLWSRQGAILTDGQKEQLRCQVVMQQVCLLRV